jgi:hypothetical protein
VEVFVADRLEHHVSPTKLGRLKNLSKHELNLPSFTDVYRAAVRNGKEVWRRAASDTVYAAVSWRNIPELLSDRMPVA